MKFLHVLGALVGFVAANNHTNGTPTTTPLVTTTPAPTSPPCANCTTTPAAPTIVYKVETTIGITSTTTKAQMEAGWIAANKTAVAPFKALADAGEAQIATAHGMTGQRASTDDVVVTAARRALEESDNRRQLTDVSLSIKVTHALDVNGAMAAGEVIDLQDAFNTFTAGKAAYESALQTAVSALPGVACTGVTSVVSVATSNGGDVKATLASNAPTTTPTASGGGGSSSGAVSNVALGSVFSGLFFVAIALLQ